MPSGMHASSDVKSHLQTNLYEGVGGGESNLGFTTETHNNFLSCCIIMGFCDGCVSPVIEDEMPLEVLRGLKLLK